MESDNRLATFNDQLSGPIVQEATEEELHK